MRKIVLIFLLNCLSIDTTISQTSRSGVLVIGNQAGAYAAAIQSARSGVKTILLSDRLEWDNTNNLAIKPELNYGVLSDIAKKNKDNTHKTWSTDSLALQLKSIADTVKRLKLVKSGLKSFKKTGKGWKVRLKDGQKISAAILLDATKENAILSQLKLNPVQNPAIDPLKESLRSRTSVAALDSGRVLPLKALINEQENRLVVLPELQTAIESIHAGQAAGATAAFCAFFETDTKKLNTRTIQGELLNYKSSLFPFGDVLPSDSSFIRLQHLALTGLLQHGFEKRGDKLYFNNDGHLSTEELKEDMKSFYSRSQIWFADHTVEKMSIEEAIQLLMYTGTRGEEMRRETERNWKTSFGLKNEYQPKRAITRREFAVLTDTFLQPFNARVDLDGQLIN